MVPQRFRQASSSSRRARELPPAALMWVPGRDAAALKDRMGGVGNGSQDVALIHHGLGRARRQAGNPPVAPAWLCKTVPGAPRCGRRPGPCERGRTRQTASSWLRACHPAPRIPAVCASSRAIQRVATPLAAPVRICPRRLASIMQTKCAGLGFVEPEVELQPSSKDGIGFVTHVAQLGQGSRHQVQGALGEVQPPSGNILGRSPSQVLECGFDRLQGNRHGEKLLDVGFGQVKHGSTVVQVARECAPVRRISILVPGLKPFPDRAFPSSRLGTRTHGLPKSQSLAP